MTRTGLIISLDLSGKPGYAILKDGIRLSSGTSKPSRDLSVIKDVYPWTYIRFAEEVSQLLLERLDFQLQGFKYHPRDINAVVIEETTSSSQNYSQKRLEFIHYAVLKLLRTYCKNAEFFYIRDGVWKSLTQARLTKDEKNNNAKISRLKAKKRKENPELKKIIVKKDTKGNQVRKITEKDAYIRRANEVFGLDLQREDEDQAAALLLGLAYFLGAPKCDGTLKGGLVEKDITNGEEKETN